MLRRAVIAQAGVLGAAVAGLVHGSPFPKKDPPGRPFWKADGETRTPDPIITSDVLYQLSYVGT